MVDLTGQSPLQPVYLDWVWLEDSDGRVYDPTLPDRPRPEFMRPYDEAAPKTRIELSAVNAFGEVRTMLDWEGAGYGAPISLKFFPMINTAERLAGDADMSDVEVWAPVLAVGADKVIGAAVNREGDVAPKALIETLIAGGKRPDFAAPPVRSLNLRAVDTSGWPRVKLALSAVTDGTPRWQAAHFALTLAERQPNLRIDQPLTGQKNVVLLADQSGSTLDNGIHRWVQRFGQGLIDGLDDRQRLAVATFGDQPFFYKLFEAGAPQNAAANVYAQLWSGPVRGRVDFTTALDHGLNAIMIELGAEPEEETEIILVTDGRPGRMKDDEWREELAKLTERARTLNAAITPVVMGAAGEAELEALARATGGRLIRITQEAAIASQAAALATELAGNMVVSFRMPATPAFTSGQRVPFSLDLEGFDGQIKSNITVPEIGPRREPGIYLTLSSGGRITTRPLIALGEKYAYQRMAGDYRVLLAAGSYESNRVLAARLEDWINYYDAKHGAYE
ncbi:MAG TPA: VWA domain-containing protein, partial [Aliiroseovarius sp.]|nr:VWA domain-containing protein [Aliiroseovarius sp.]